jgi:hypothetical protein
MATRLQTDLPVSPVQGAEVARRLVCGERESCTMMHGGGWWSFLRYDESKGRPQVTRQLLLRVLGYARPYWRSLSLVLVAIGVIALLGLVPPLLIRDLIDNVIPKEDYALLHPHQIG